MRGKLAVRAVAGATSETASKKMPNGMLGGVPLADVEAALSAALNASLCVPARERPAFIARRLVGDANDALPALPADLRAAVRERSYPLDPPSRADRLSIALTARGRDNVASYTEPSAPRVRWRGVPASRAVS